MWNVTYKLVIDIIIDPDYPDKEFYHYLQSFLFMNKTNKEKKNYYSFDFLIQYLSFI